MSENNEKKISETLKKLISMGVGSAFLTEETIRNALNDMPLPKDIVTGLIQNAKKSKDDLSDSLKDEFGKYLKKVDIRTLIDYTLEKYDIEVNAKVKFKEKKKTKSSK